MLGEEKLTSPHRPVKRVVAQEVLEAAAADPEERRGLIHGFGVLAQGRRRPVQAGTDLKMEAAATSTARMQIAQVNH